MAGLLLTLLKELLERKRTIVKLSGGLMIQYRQADDTDPDRLFCYRVGVAPSLTELAVVQQNLGRLMPGSYIVQRKELVEYQGKDGLMRFGYVITWDRAAQQRSFITEAETQGAYE